MFFGRRREGEDLLEQVYVERVVVVHAPSGSGKTSLLQAFLIPQLKERAFCTQVTPLRPSAMFLHRKSKETPAIELRMALLESFGLPPHEQHAASTEATLGAIRATGDNSVDGALMLIVVDQTEEIFAREEIDTAFQRSVFDALGELADDPSVWLVLSIREDYLARLLAYEDVFAKGLRSRFAVPLFTGLVAQDIVASSLEAFNVKVSQTKLKQLALTLARSNFSARSNKLSDATVLSERVVEPLFLQLVARRWWIEARGDADALERATIEEESLTMALGAHIDEAFETAARTVDDADDGQARQMDLRLTIQDCLTDGASRKQGDLPDRHHDAAITLESCGILRRTHPSSDRVELAHDQLVHALEVSNRKWMQALPNGELAYRAHRWRASRRDRSKLLSAPELLTWWRQRLSLSADEREYVSESVRGSLIWPSIYASIFLAFLVATIWINEERRQAVEERDGFQRQTRDERRRFEEGKHSFDVQAQIATAYTALSSRDAAAASMAAMEALRVARQKPVDRANLTARSESVLGRIAALNPAVDRWTIGQSAIHILDATADGKLVACQAGQRIRLDWATRTSVVSTERCDPPTLPEPAQLQSSVFELRTTKDRNHYKTKPGFEGMVRTAYAFLELTRPNAELWERRVWPTFASEELLQRRGNELDYPPREILPDISVGNVFLLDDRLVGYSISPRARFYPWQAKLAGAEKCAREPVAAEDSENDHCRILEVERPIQLFRSALASVSQAIVNSTADPRGYVLFASSNDGQLARIRWKTKSNGLVWPAQHLLQNRNSPASSIFFDRVKRRVWLVDAARAPTILSRTPNAVAKGSSFFRAMWCGAAQCADRTAVILRRDGAIGWVDLDALDLDAVNPDPRKGYAWLNRLSISDVAPIGGGFAVAVGTKNRTSPLIALIHADTSTKVARFLDFPGAADAQGVLSGLPNMIDAAEEVLVFATGQSAFVVCDKTPPPSAPTISNCKSVSTSLSVTAIDVGDHGGRLAIAVGYTDGSVQLFGRDGLSLRATGSQPAASAVDLRYVAHFGPVRSALVFTTGDGVSRVATGGDDGRVKVWIFEPGQSGDSRVSQVPLNVASHDGSVSVLEHEDGRLFSSGAHSETFSVPIDSSLVTREVCQNYVVSRPPDATPDREPTPRFESCEVDARLIPEEGDGR
jgi:hypothetical protein